MRTTYVPGHWLVFRYDLERPPPRTVTPDCLSVAPTVLVDLAGRERRQDQPFLIGPDGQPDPRVNAFFASARMLARSPLTWAKYAQSIALWLNFLLVSGQRWDAASEEDAEYFKQWRLSDQNNTGLVEGSTFAANLAALRAFYCWAAARYSVVDPVAAVDDFDLRPRGGARSAREVARPWRLPAVARCGVAGPGPEWPR